MSETNKQEKKGSKWKSFLGQQVVADLTEDASRYSKPKEGVPTQREAEGEPAPVKEAPVPAEQAITPDEGSKAQDEKGAPVKETAPEKKKVAGAEVSEAAGEGEAREPVTEPEAEPVSELDAEPEPESEPESEAGEEEKESPREKRKTSSVAVARPRGKVSGRIKISARGIPGRLSHKTHKKKSTAELLAKMWDKPERVGSDRAYIRPTEKYYAAALAFYHDMPRTAVFERLFQLYNMLSSDLDDACAAYDAYVAEHPDTLEPGTFPAKKQKQIEE